MRDGCFGSRRLWQVIVGSLFVALIITAISAAKSKPTQKRQSFLLPQYPCRMVPPEFGR